MVLPVGMGDPVAIGALFDVVVTDFTTATAPLLVLPANPKRVCFLIAPGGGLGGAAGFSPKANATIGVGLATGQILDIHFSRHSVLAQLPWYLVSGSNVSFEVIELILRDA